MKISIWQQFSSNHSADFTLVGTFESSEKAEEVGQELRKIIETIGRWWQQQGEIEDCLDKVEQMRDSKQLTPPEQAIERQYQIDWGKEPIDWTLTPEASKVVEVFRNLVFLGPFGDTWSSSQPFEQLIQKWGGKIVSENEYSEHRLTFRVSFVALDDGHADEIMEELKTAWQKFLDDPQRLGRPPGKYRRNGLGFSIAQFRIFWFDSGEMLTIFQRLIEWIEAMGCTITNYAIEETPL